jgi:DNA repair protein SbcD/Mre11
MKLLHTSDWHLGARLGGIDRADDAFARIAELCAVIDTHQVDCLLIAGDVFDETRADRLPALLHRLGGLLRPRVADGLKVVALAGNHDRPHVFPLLQSAAALLGAHDGSGQVVFTDTPRLVTVTSRDHAEVIQLACLPYPFHERYDLAAQNWPTRDAKHRDLGDAVRRAMSELAAEAEHTNPGVPTLMAGHLLIRGATVGEGFYCLSEAEDVPVERGDLPGYAYVALGHIHKPQTLGADQIRYCGSIERMDLGEAADDKAAVLVTLDSHRVVDTIPVPVAATPFARVEATDADDLAAAHAALVDPDQTLVTLTVHDTGATRIGALVAQARQLFPRLYGHPQILRSATRPALGAGAGLDRADVAGTVRTYLARTLADDPDAPALRDLACELLAEEGIVADLTPRPGDTTAPNSPRPAPATPTSEATA